ncbi:dolichyl-phosphate-mannose--protein mannosyltransferase [Arthrobacter sp. H14]|uniref:dolichyl-phosphate-mannose--protein mannosyltransferase n=1 Tax=Arthrobacter sp. H14 TaxID=1312959 RepID=UPI0009DF1897|nr:phospholipid carrier-dependent glycosyltransferase [Arthrobacter sp. H14]
MPSTPAQNARWVEAPSTFYSAAGLRRRLLGDPLTLRLWGWLIPILTAVVGGLLRFVRLGQPESLIFDETYYVKDAYSYLLSGYERDWPDDANAAFAGGDQSVIKDSASYVVHPPAGKWMIAFGMWIFGPDSSFGWRFSAALAGTISILLIALIAQKMFHSTTLGGIAGLLVAVDGHHLVHSRTSLLDILLMFWVVVAFGALLLDRDDGRRRLARRLAARTGAGGIPSRAQLASGPWLGMRWWRLAAGIAMGLAVGTKWSGLFFLAAFGLMTVLWDLNARRIAGVRSWFTAGVVKDGLFAFVCMVPVAALTYLASWTGWLLSRNAYDRNWAAENPSSTWGWLPDSLRSLAEYHRSAYSFHQGLSSEHPYEANPWTWLVMGRPTSFYFEDPARGQDGCQVEECAQAISVVGNPLIWWSAALALLVLLFYWIGRRDWRAGAILAGVAAGYLPWFMYPDRTTFFFYAIAFEPFLILGLVYCLGLILGRSSAPAWRRQSGIILVGAFVVTALAVSAFFLPIWTAETIPYEHWQLRMWMPSWI